MQTPLTTPSSRRGWTASRVALSVLFAAGAALAGLGAFSPGSAAAQPCGQAGLGPGAAWELSDLPAELNLTPDQRVAIGGALEKLKSACEEHQALRQSRRESNREGRRGRSAPGVRAGNERPMMLTEFLRESAAILDADQFAVLTRHLAQQREEAAAQVRARRDHRRGDMGSWGRPGRGADARPGRGADARPGRGLGQADEFDRLNACRADGRAARNLEDMEERHARRAEFLRDVLRLDADQVSRLDEILSRAVKAQASLHEQVVAGALEPVQARDDHWQIHKSTTESIRGLLSADQVKRFDALEALQPAGPHGAHAGFGGRWGGRHHGLGQSDAFGSGDAAGERTGAATGGEAAAGTDGESAGALGLSANPNPFHASTVILARDRAAEGPLEVLTVEGRHVRTLSAGPQGWVWDGRDDSGEEVPAGTYFAQPVSGDAPAVRIVRLR